MGEARQECPRCARPPGGRHFGFCPRNAANVPTASLGSMRLIYPSKGRFAATRADGKVVTGLNPGVPFVRPPKPRTAGGVPARGCWWYTGGVDAKGEPLIESLDAAATKAATAEFLEKFARLGL